MRFPSPNLQIGFALKLQALRSTALQEALLETIQGLDVGSVDRELNELTPPGALSKMAGAGLRGELLFATPTVLGAAPKLLAYYRLLLGYSQKDFYSGPTKYGAGPFRAFEIAGQISAKMAPRTHELCEALCFSAGELLAGLDSQQLTAAFLADLSLLTLGPHFRGGANNAVGSGGVKDVQAIIAAIVQSAGAIVAGNLLTLKNAAGRKVLVEFGADPDVTIKQFLPSGQFQNQLAIEIKAGRDASNIYNRLGEAEKSHNSAGANGFTQCWTIVNIDPFDLKIAAVKSPNTDRFYNLAQLKAGKGHIYEDFREQLTALIGIADSRRVRRGSKRVT